MDRREVFGLCALILVVSSVGTQALPLGDGLRRQPSPMMIHVAKKKPKSKASSDQQEYYKLELKEVQVTSRKKSEVKPPRESGSGMATGRRTYRPN